MRVQSERQAGLAGGSMVLDAAAEGRAHHGPTDNCDPKRLAEIPEAITFYPGAEEFRGASRCASVRPVRVDAADGVSEEFSDL